MDRAVSLSLPEDATELADTKALAAHRLHVCQATDTLEQDELYKSLVKYDLVKSSSQLPEVGSTD